VDEGEEAQEDGEEGADRSALAGPRQRRIALQPPGQRKANLAEAHRQRQHEGELTELVDHGWARPSAGSLSPRRHSPCFFSAAATCGGMYFSSCLANTSVATKTPLAS
jgi:hypothetical protein